MKRFNSIITAILASALLTTQIQAQECYEEDWCCADAYCDSGYATFLSAALPIGALAVAAIIIATTNRNGCSCSSSCCYSTYQSCRCSSGSYSHSCSCECSSY